MGQWVKIKAADGHGLSAYQSQPKGVPRGGLVIIQEIFGVNAYIRSVVDTYAEAGFLTIAPALFDRYEAGVELTYEGADLQRAYGLYQKLTPETALLDVAAAFAQVQSANFSSGVVGYCYGGFMSWLSATRGPLNGIRPKACVAYYPGGIGTVAEEQPSCPVLLHFGANDTHVGADQVEAVRNAHPDVELFVYEGAEHGFSCNARGSFQPEAASLAQKRTLAFLQEHLA